MSQRDRILVIGSGLRSYRAYVLEAIRRAGYHVTLITPSAPSWEKELVNEVIVVNPADVPGARAAARAAHSLTPFDGVLTYNETTVELAAILAEDMDLPGPGVAAARRCRDKLLTRQALRDGGLITPECVVVEERSLGELARTFPFPAVLKPRAGYASINIVKLERPEDLRPAWDSVHGDDAAAPDVRREFLLEEYLDGPEFSLETVVVGGVAFPVCMTDKHKSAEPYFEEVGHQVPAEVPADEAAAVVGGAVTALGLAHCVIHPELRKTSRGWAIVEINARLAGDKIPRLVELATGVELSRATAEVALGRRMDLAPTRDGSATIGFFVPAEPQVVGRAPSRPPIDGLAEFEFWAATGEVVAPPPERFTTRLGYAIAVGRDGREAERRMREIIAHVSAETGLSLVTW